MPWWAPRGLAHGALGSPWLVGSGIDRLNLTAPGAQQRAAWLCLATPGTSGLLEWSDRLDSAPSNALAGVDMTHTWLLLDCFFSR